MKTDFDTIQKENTFRHHSKRKHIQRENTFSLINNERNFLYRMRDNVIDENGFAVLFFAQNVVEDGDKVFASFKLHISQH
jgi:hypothetical protein